MPVKRNRLQTGNLKIDLQMVLQIGPDARTIHKRIDAGSLQHLAGADAGSLQDLG